jgi:hypothetical protein
VRIEYNTVKYKVERVDYSISLSLVHLCVMSVLPRSANLSHQCRPLCIIYRFIHDDPPDISIIYNPVSVISSIISSGSSSIASVCGVFISVPVTSAYHPTAHLISFITVPRIWIKFFASISVNQTLFPQTTRLINLSNNASVALSLNFNCLVRPFFPRSLSWPRPQVGLASDSRPLVPWH